MLETHGEAVTWAPLGKRWNIKGIKGIKGILNEDVGALTDAAENHNTERSRIFFNSQKDSNRYFLKKF